MMKKILSVCLILMLLLSSAMAQETLVSHAAELVQRMDVLAGSEAYRTCIGVANGEMGELAESFAAGNHAQPRLIVAANVDNFASMVIRQMLDTGMAMEPETEAELLNKLASSAVLQVVGSKGTVTLAAVSALTTSEVLAWNGEGERGAYILLYEDAAPAAVTWRAENGAATLSAIFLPDDELAACADADAVEAWFAAQGMPLECEKYQ